MKLCSVTFQKTAAFNDLSCPLQVPRDSPSPLMLLHDYHQPMQWKCTQSENI